MSLSAWFLIPAAVVAGTIVLAYFMGVEVGKDRRDD